MLILLGLIVILAIHSLTLDGAGKGMQYFLVPDMDKIKEVGLGNIIIEAMRQAFFTLSVGMGSMMIFGSYIGKERALVGEGITISPRRISIIYFVIFSTPFWMDARIFY